MAEPGGGKGNHEPVSPARLDRFDPPHRAARSRRRWAGEAGGQPMSRSSGWAGSAAPALQYLAASGIGKLTLVDDDVVDTSEPPSRQTIFTHPLMSGPWPER